LAIGLFGHQPYKPDEAYTVGLVKSMVDSGDWVLPRLVGEPFLEKPPLFYAVAALFAKSLGWLPLHEAARLATLLFMGLGLLAIGATAKTLYGTGQGRFATLITLATIGAVGPMHQLITDTGLFAGMAIGLLGIVHGPRRPALGGALMGTGLAVSFLSKGLLGPGLITCAALALGTLRPWRCWSFAKAALIAASIALPLAAGWLVPLALRAPDQLQVWFYDNNLGRFFGWNDLGPKKDLLFYARKLAWYTQPALPLALWGWLRRTRGEPAKRQSDLQRAPLVLLIVGIAVLTCASDGRELYAFVLVPPLSVAAIGGLHMVPLPIERRLALLLAAVLLLASASAMAFWGVAMLEPSVTASLPQSIALPHMLSPSPATMLVYCMAVASAFGLAGYALRQPLRGALPLTAAAGIALLWSSLVLPFSSCLDALKGYRAVALSLADHLPATECVASLGLGEGERALLDYYVGLRTQRMETSSTADRCDALLVQSLADGPGIASRDWSLVWQGSRAGNDSSIMRLYVRPGYDFAPWDASLSAHL
jgi:4-amino-4-deoxy-L-arabinose transferase-like glycosyltransferase